MRLLNLLLLILATTSFLATAAKGCNDNGSEIPLTPFPTLEVAAIAAVPEPDARNFSKATPTPTTPLPQGPYVPAALDSTEGPAVAGTATTSNEPYVTIALERPEGTAIAGKEWKIDFTVTNRSTAPAYDVNLVFEVVGRARLVYLDLPHGVCVETKCQISSFDGNEAVTGHIVLVPDLGFQGYVRTDVAIAWPMSGTKRGSSIASLTTQVLNITGPGKLLWSASVESDSMGCSDYQVAIGQDAVYPVYHREIYALSRFGGDVKWRIEGEIHMFTPNLEDDSIYILGSEPGDSWLWSDSVSSIDSASGELNWRHPLDEQARGQLVVYGDAVYFTVRDYVGDRVSNYTDLVALDKATGVLNWRYRVDKRHNSPATEFEGDIYFVTSGPGPNFLHSVDALTGELNRKYPVPAGSHSKPLVNKGVVYLVTSDEQIYSMELSSGETGWEYRPGGPVDNVLGIYEGNLYFLLYDRQEPGYVAVDAVDAETGARAWRYQPGGTFRNLSVTDGGIYVSTPTSLTSLDASTGDINWQRDYAGICGSLAAVDGYLYGRASNDEQGFTAFAIRGD